jgi:hypothetical protein
MTRLLRITVVALASALVAGAAASAQTPRATATPAPVVVLIGCVELMTPVTPTNPATRVVPTYKIMDVQPGGTGQKPMTLAAEYHIVGPDSIVFGKFENQRVEVTGSITAAPAQAPTPPPGRGQRAQTPLPSTFTVTALKVVSTECK